MNHQLKLVKPTGDLIKSPDENATVPVPLPVIMVQVNGNYTALDRKLWALLLHLGWDELETKSQVGQWHELEEVEVRQLVEKFSGTKDLELIWQSALRLASTTVQYEFDDENDERWEGVSSLFLAMRKKKANDKKFRFMFPSPLVPLLKEPNRFARLRIQFLLSLKSKYAVTLYELFEATVNKRVPVINATVEDIRQWLKVPDGKLNQWDYFYKKALKPALDEINKNPDEAGFSVSYELKRGGRGGKVQGITFTLRKSTSRLKLESNLQSSKDTKELVRSNALIPPFRGTAIYDKVRKIAKGMDVYQLEKEWREWVIKREMSINNPEAHFMAFVKKRYLPSK